MGRDSKSAMLDVNFPAPLLARASKEELMAEIESLKPPMFHSPYPSGRNIHHVKANADSTAWLHEHKLETVYEDPARWQHFLRQNLGDVMTRAYPDATEERMVWLCAYSWWLFLVDDLLDGRGYYSSPEKSTPFYVDVNLLMMWSFPDNPLLYNNFVELVNCFPEEEQQAIFEKVDAKLVEARQHPGSAYDASNSGPVIIALKDLWVRLLAGAPETSVLRWGYSMQEYYLSNIYEAKNRTSLVVPTLPEYIVIRRNLSAVYPCMLLVDFSESFTTCLPQEIFESPEMKILHDAINDIVAFHNDMYSVKKELLEGEVHNLVTVISHQSACTFSDAMELALEMLEERIQVLDQAVIDLEAISTPKNQRMVAAYIKTAHFWSSGTHDFTVLSNHRYLWDMSASQWWREKSPQTTA